MITLTRESSLFLEGDSICDRTLQYQALNGTLAWIDSFYLAPAGGSFCRPTCVSKATTGATTTTIAGRIAGELAVQAYTHALIQVGINDSQGAISQATSLANASTILGACAAAGIKGGIWLGPFCNGEKTPTGANTFDTTNPGIDLLDNALIALVPTFAGWSYVSARRLIYSAVEPVINPGSTNSGVLTVAVTGGTGPGIHPNPSGCALITAAMQAQIALT